MLTPWWCCGEGPRIALLVPRARSTSTPETYVRSAVPGDTPERRVKSRRPGRAAVRRYDCDARVAPLRCSDPAAYRCAQAPEPCALVRHRHAPHAGSRPGGSRASRPRRSRTRSARSARAGSRRGAARRWCGSPGRGRAGPWCRGARRCARRRCTPASSSSVVPLPACSCSRERTASAISRRPPYPTAMLTSSPSTSRVDSAAVFRRSATDGRQQVERAHRVQPPALLLGERLDGVADDARAAARAPWPGGSGCRWRAATA